jgi:predicted nucleic acid-binding protein
LDSQGFLLDTNVISQLTKARPNEAAMRWLGMVKPLQLHLSVITLTEIRYGTESMQKGRKRTDFEHWLDENLPRMFPARILHVNERVADEAGRLIAHAKKAATTPDLADILIAATAIVHGLEIATLNREHFEKLPVTLVVF